MGPDHPLCLGPGQSDPVEDRVPEASRVHPDARGGPRSRCPARGHGVLLMASGATVVIMARVAPSTRLEGRPCRCTANGSDRRSGSWPGGMAIGALTAERT